MDEISFLVRIIGDDDGSISFLQMLARATIIFCYGLLLLRVSTPRLFGKATPVDIVLTIIIGSNLSRTLTGNAPFLEVMGTTAFLVALHWLMTRVAIHWKPFSDLVKGKPRVLASDGKIDRQAMRKNAVGSRDLLAAVHAAGGTELSDIEYATLERDGDIEIVLRSG